MDTIKRRVRELLETADVRVNGDRPWDIQIHNENLYRCLLKKGSLGLGEAYMDCWWDAERPDEFFYHIFSADLEQKIRESWPLFWLRLKSWIGNPQKESRAYEIGKQHYDIGNELYEAMLDPLMMYTCGYWHGADTLAEAQEIKLDHICRILNLKAGDRVLDIGCGWGGFSRFAAEHYGTHVVGITVSNEQAKFARQRCKGLPVEIRLQDYRSVDETFDHIISLGMFEHVGRKNYRAYMQMVQHCLAPKGVFVLHTIGGNRSVINTDPWIEKYIFPNSMIPSVRQVGEAIDDVFVLENWSNHRHNYDKTLMAWYQNFKEHWPKLKQNYSKHFYRLWTYYLLASAGSFRAGKNNQWQIVLTHKQHSGKVQVPPLEPQKSNTHYS